MGTLTFFLHGTGQHEKGRVKTVISALSQFCSSGGYAVSGPGGKAAEGKDRYIPGTYKINPQTGEKTPNKTVVPTKITELVATATGWGVDQNLIEMLIQVERQQPPPDTINMVGFSRGADACLRFANVMYEFYPHIKINIFAIEPVPGFGRDGAEQGKIIPPNVSHYVSIIAMHENRRLFRPQDYSSLKPSDYEATKVECLPLPGTHPVHSRFADDRPGTREASELFQDIAIEQLEAWGTTFREDPRYPIKLNTKGRVSSYEVRTDTDPIGIIFKYSTMISDINSYGKLSAARLMARHPEDYSPILSHCFINQHHLRLFAKTFPVTYRYMLDPTEDRNENSLTELKQYPRVQEWLNKTFEAHPEKKKRIYFDINKDKLDGNYLRVAMAVHDFRKNPLNTSADKKLAQKLMDDCRNILNRPFGSKIATEEGEIISTKEDEIKRKVDQFCQKNPKSRLTNGLQERFNAKELSLATRLAHDLRAARNQNLFQSLVEKIESALSSRKENYYITVNGVLTEAIVRLQAEPKMTKENAVSLMSVSLKGLRQQRELVGIARKSTAEIILEKLMARTESDITLAKKSKLQPSDQPKEEGLWRRSK
jgi:hypothetical protein